MGYRAKKNNFHQKNVGWPRNTLRDVQPLRDDPLVIRKMQIKTTLRFHHTPVRITKIKNSRDNRCWRGCGESGTLLYCWWDCKMAQPLWKSVWLFLRKLGMTLPEDPGIPLLGIYPEDSPTYNKDPCSTMLIAALFITARSCKQPRCPSTKEWIQKMWYIYTMKYYSTIKIMNSCNL